MDIDNTLQKFRELENVQSKTKLEPQGDQVEKHFLVTHSRDENRKYVVELPFNLRSEKLYMELLNVSNRWSDDYNKSNSCGYITFTLCGSISIWDTCVRCRQRKSLLAISSFFPTTQC